MVNQEEAASFTTFGVYLSMIIEVQLAIVIDLNDDSLIETFSIWVNIDPY
jgi:hypothetical protein